METTKETRRAPAKRRRPPQNRRVAPAGSRRTASQPVRRKKSAPPQRKARRYNPDKPRVVYTPPKPLSRSMLLVRLASVVAVVLALTFGMSIFFKVENITVSGAVKYDPWTVKEASGIQIGDGLLSFGEAKASAKIRNALPYVDQVRIGIKLPDTVNIEIKEFDVVYAIRDVSDAWWLITSEGLVVEKADRATADDCTRVLGVRLGSPVPGQKAVAQEDPVEAPTEGTEETLAPVTVTAADRLKTALSILYYMESCGILGDAASVDVTDLGNLELWYGSRFQVKLGDTSRLEYKIQCMNAAINGSDPANTLKEYDSGVLDISFTIKENQLIYQGFTD